MKDWCVRTYSGFIRRTMILFVLVWKCERALKVSNVLHVGHVHWLFAFLFFSLLLFISLSHLERKLLYFFNGCSSVLYQCCRTNQAISPDTQHSSETYAHCLFRSPTTIIITIIIINNIIIIVIIINSCIFYCSYYLFCTHRVLFLIGGELLQ